VVEEVAPPAPAPQSAPVVETAPVPEPPSEAMPDPKPVAEAAPDPAPEPGADPDPGPGADPDPGPRAEPAPEPLDLARFEQIWPAVLDSLATSASGMVASYFDGSRPSGLEGEKLTIGFPSDAAFNRRNAERPECRQQLADALSAVTGSRFSVEYASLDSGQQATDPESEVMDEEDFIARVKSDFNAEEVI
jgi:hypothetical protein